MPHVGGDKNAIDCQGDRSNAHIAQAEAGLKIAEILKMIYGFIIERQNNYSAVG